MTLPMLFLLAPLVLAKDADIPAYDALLKAHVSAGRVDYQGLKAQGSAMDGVLSQLADAQVAGLSKAQRMAFWINAYNALTLDLIADNLPIGSIMDLDGGKVWDTRSYTVAGRKVTLNQIEHQILRPMGDPRIHAAINCASRGCPPLLGEAFTAAGLDDQLDRAVQAWARGNGVSVAPGRVGVNSIFDWFGDDFTGSYGPAHFDIPGVDGKPEAAINFLAPHLDEATRQKLQAGGYQTYWTTYDWKLNKK